MAANQAWSVRMADSVMRRNVPFRWHYEHGLAHRALEQVWRRTGDARYFDFIRRAVEPFISADGSIATYSVQEFNLDQINPGRTLLMLWRETHDEKYARAAHLLRSQLRQQPRTNDGGFWHKKIYPFQMWLDGVYMAAPFYTEYGKVFAEPAAFDDVAHEIALIEKHTRNPQTGLLYHGWDESRQMKWADPQTGCSPHAWGRAMGWLAMAIPDVLDNFPQDHPRRPEIVPVFQRLIDAALTVQDKASGVWRLVLDQGDREGNYPEASVSCMFVCALAKGVRQGLLARKYLAAARRGYRGILKEFIRVEGDGMVNLERICSVGGLGGVPYRDGSFAYYLSERISTNDYKGVGPFVLASLELESAG